MKIIVCGAGQVGKSVVSYLVKGNNDITVIDDDNYRLDELSKEFDILPIQGKPSHPDILERAGAKECDMILALTEVDEVNMVICQLAYTLFSIPKKIASVNSETFMDPLWGMLYNDNHLPIDLLISPDIDIADNILHLLQYPGCAGILPILGHNAYILTLDIDEHCPMLGVELQQFDRYDDLDIGLINIVRQNQSLLPLPEQTLQVGDQINILVKKDDVYSTISAFGKEKPANERLVIFGGNEISAYIGNRLEHDDSIVSCRLIEENLSKARQLARELNHIVVIHGEMMSDVILKEADITHADAAIALTDNDKDNLLASLLASKNGVETTISVINTPSYNNLMFNITDNILVDRSAITISRLLKEIRKAKLQEAWSIARGMGEIWEIRLGEDNFCAHKQIEEIKLSPLCRVFALQRGDKIIYPTPKTVLETGDFLLIYVDSSTIKQVEDILC
jgi:trk system potassium uptake protein TrkA